MLAEVSPSQEITVVGTGYLAYSSVSVLIYSSPVVLGTTVADANGGFSTPVTVPADLAVGTHNLVASGVDPAGVVHFIRMPVTIVAAAVTSSSSTPASTTVTTAASSTEFVAEDHTGGTLSNTGVQLLPMIFAAIVLISAGTLLIGLGYRRRSVRREH